MTLRKRLFWLFAPLLALALVIAYLLSQSLILTRFDRQDAALLVAEAERVRALLDNDLKRNLDLLLSYAQWDASYEFMLGQHPDFVQRNMDSEALRQMNFDFMIYLAADGRVRAEQWLPPDLPDLLALGSNKPRSHESLRTSILALAERLRHRDGEGPRGQLVALQGVPLILVMSGISNNQNSLPSVGTLVAGHFIDGERAENLQTQLDGAMRLLPPDEEMVRWKMLSSLDQTSINQIEISPRRILDDAHHQVVLLFSNSLDEPELMFELTRERRLYLEGRKAIAIFLAQAGTVGIAAWLLIYLGLEFGILRRVSRMHREIADIGPETAGQRLSDAGRDELGRLAAETNRMLARLEQSETRDREILDAIQDGYFELTPDGTIQAVNRALCSMLGYPAEELLQRSFETVLEEQDIQRARELFRQSWNAGSDATFAAPFRRRNGSQGYYETRFSLIRDAQGNCVGYRGILRDISDQMAYQQHLLDMAYRDPLTGLGNRKAFHEQLRQSIEQSQQPLALLFLDLDHFKEVNDQFGHDVGDTLLQHIAERLRGAVRQPDRVYRLGGDEFTLILADSAAETAQKLAERLREALQGAIRIGALSIDFVTPSIGIALYPQHANDPDGLIKAADSAMYEAKRERNRACLYHPGMLSSSPQSG